MFCKKCGKDVPYGVVICEECATGKASETQYKAPQTVSQPVQTPPDSRYSSTSGQSSSYPEINGPSQPYSPQPIVQTTNGMAMASMIISIISIFLVFLGIAGVVGILGLILGIVARNQIKASGGRQGGAGMATTGIVISSIAIFLSILLLAILFPVFQKAREKARQPYNPGVRMDKLNTAPVFSDYNTVIHSTVNWSDSMKNKV